MACCQWQAMSQQCAATQDDEHSYIYHAYIHNIYIPYSLQNAWFLSVYMCTCFGSSSSNGTEVFLHCCCHDYWLWLQHKFRADLRYQYEYDCVYQTGSCYYTPTSNSISYLVCNLQILCLYMYERPIWTINEQIYSLHYCYHFGFEHTHFQNTTNCFQNNISTLQICSAEPKLCEDAFSAVYFSSHSLTHNPHS